MTVVASSTPARADGTASQQSAIRVAVVVVNWNTAHLLHDCLDSIVTGVAEADVEADIVVVDNGSTDDSLQVLAQRADVRVLRNAENAGYQAACNQGTRAAVGDIVVHVNTDARPGPGTIARFVDVLCAEPDVGIVAPRLCYGDGSFQRWTAGRRPGVASLVVSFLLGDRWFPGHGVWIGSDDRTERNVDWVSSACLAVRREVFDAIGGLDERFFAYMDDVDLGVGCRALGRTVRYDPTVTAVHFMGGSQDHPGSAASPTAIRALVAWCRWRGGRAFAAVAVTIVTTGFAMRVVAHSIAALVGRSTFAAAQRHLAHARIAATSWSRP